MLETNKLSTFAIQAEELSARLSAYLLLVSTIHWISPIGSSIHPRVVRLRECIPITIIEMSSIVWPSPLVPKIRSWLQYSTGKRFSNTSIDSQ